MKKYILFVFCFVFTNIANAQLSVHSGFTTGMNRYTFSVDGPNDVLQSGIGEEITYGVPIRVAKGKWSFQTGIYSTSLSRAFYFKTPDGTQYGDKNDDQSSISTLEIPFIVSKEFKLVNRVSLAPKVGLVWLTDKTNSDSTDVFSGTISEPDFEVLGGVSSVVNKNKFLAEAGMDLNIYPFRYFILTAGATYRYGLQQIETTDITYKLDGEEFTETLKSRGNGFNFYIGIKVPIHILHGGHQRSLFE